MTTRLLRSSLLCLLGLCLPAPALAQVGKLSADDPQGDYGAYYDAYPYQGVEGEILTVALSSSAFDPYLVVLGPDGSVVWEKDDSAGQGLGVLETVTLSATGTYQIVVTSASPAETGRYELNLQGERATVPPTPAPPSAAAEPNVVQGRVTDEQGDPVPNATVTISGYTGTGATVVERAQTDAQGHYRQAVPSGLYNVDAEAVVDYGGETFHLYLHPADDSCEELFSERGIVKDFVLKLTGLQTCLNGPDPDNYNSYSGGTVFVNYAFPRALPAEARLTFTLTPTGPLLDGSQGEVLSFTRSAAAADSGYGAPLETTMYLHDIPVGPYRISGHATLPDGSSQPLRFGPYLSDEAAESHDFAFEAVRMWPYGVRVTSIDAYDSSWRGD